MLRVKMKFKGLKLTYFHYAFATIKDIGLEGFCLEKEG